MSLRDVPRDQLVVVPLPVMVAVADYLAARPYREVAPLAAELSQLVTLREHLARPKKENT